MQLREGEVTVKIIKRHLTPYVLKLLKIFLLMLPLFALLFYIASEVDGEWILYVFAAISFFLGIVIAFISIDYLLDKLYITNKRLIWVDWKSLINKEEHETELLDIIDIETREKGILSKLHIFDYGLLEVETAATKTCIYFSDCPNPEGLKHFINLQIAKRRSKVFGKSGQAAPTGGPTNAPMSQSEEEWSVN